MAQIIVTEFVSLDGVVEDPGGSENFRFSGWTKVLKLTESRTVDDNVLILIYRR